ncbi:MAG: helix-turn-helix transcriptional regulator [Lachnospiraceae bacterium]|nr:helix-turn-helix transcriptional regulator [Lachnospiraceae bacterium]
MAIHAYDESYVTSAQNILGHAVDYAVITLGIEPDDFANAFAVSSCSKQFAQGNPSFVAGRNGCELVREILDEVKISYPDKEDEMYLDKSAEYWAGWALAYFQWYSDLSFIEILNFVALSEIMMMYEPYHEMDILQFVSAMNERLETKQTKTRLREKREISNLSQSELSILSDVPIRQIQLFEQGKRKINNTAAVTLYKLSKALNCKMDDLIEKRQI